MTAEAVPISCVAIDVETLDTLALWSPVADGIPFAAGAMSWPGFTPQQMQGAWEAFQEAVMIREALGTGVRHWVEMYSEEDLPPNSDGPMAAATDLACTVADEARNHLLYGGPR